MGEETAHIGGRVAIGFDVGHVEDATVSGLTIGALDILKAVQQSSDAGLVRGGTGAQEIWIVKLAQLSALENLVAAAACFGEVAGGLDVNFLGDGFKTISVIEGLLRMSKLLKSL